MIMDKKFCIFILSFARSNNVKTVNTLINSNYTGDYFILCSNDDMEYINYVKTFGKDKVIIFDKDEYIKKTDTIDNFNSKKVVLYARNACFDFAKNMGYEYFCEMDDDYLSFEYRYIEDNKLKVKKIDDFDFVVENILDLMKCGNILTIAMAQNGDFVGGANSQLAQDRIKRKAMNSFFFKTDSPYRFRGTLNDDVNYYCEYGKIGNVIITVADISLRQIPTQMQKGGATDIYIDNGTYVKSFYSVIPCPSFVKVKDMISKHGRIHHKVSWNNAVPKIISDSYMKKE